MRDQQSNGLANRRTLTKRDLRRLHCAGWNAAKIKAEKHGQWTRFIDPDPGDYVNSATRIDYTRQYPFPTHHTRETESIDRETHLHQMLLTRINRIDSGTPLPPTYGHDSNQSQHPHSSPIVPVSNNTPNHPSHCPIPFEVADLPQAARAVQKRRGGRFRTPRTPPVQRERPQTPSELRVVSRIGGIPRREVFRMREFPKVAARWRWTLSEAQWMRGR
jgi:hypothetical protein